jgi:hypothetical protein
MSCFNKEVQMPGEYATRAIEALEQVEIEVGDAKAETTKLLASAVVFALLDVARAVRSLK